MGGNLAAETVLYVEDEECDRLFMETAFRKAGMGEVFRVVADGREAINWLAGSGVYADRGQHPVPAVVLLDLNLPEVPGFEVLRWMRKHPDYQAIPVVIFSSSTREEDKVRAAELGANEFLEKPTSGLKFVEVARKLKERWLGSGLEG